MAHKDKKKPFGARALTRVFSVGNNGATKFRKFKRKSDEESDELKVQRQQNALKRTLQRGTKQARRNRFV